MLMELGHDRGFLGGATRGPYRYNLRFLPLRVAVGIVSPSYFGVLDEYPYWNAVFVLYRKDELAEALDVMEKIGIGMYGDYAMPGDIIYVEAATSEDSEIVRIGDRLEVEFIRDQLPFSFDDLARELAAAYSEIRPIFGPSAPNVDTLVTLLLREAVIPTVAWREGYFTPKDKYGKICLPMPRELPAVIDGFRRGLVCQLAHEATSAQADLWMLEASMALIGAAKTSPPRDWREPEPLNRALHEESDTPAAVERLADAKAQCHRIGEYLLARGDRGQFLRCLAAHEPALTGNATERAVKSMYGFSVDSLFASARHSA